jgi:hypothetical protein
VKVALAVSYLRANLLSRIIREDPEERGMGRLSDPIFIHKTGYSVPYKMEQSMSMVEDLVVEMLGETKDMVGVR